VAVTRFAELRPPDADLSARMAAAEQVHAAMIEATRSGRTLGDVFAAAQAAYADAGHADEWRLHHQGGIIGYQGRERIAVPGDPTVIRAGMAFAWNPSVAGAKAEETVLLADDGPRFLTRGRSAL
jgi:antitoxin VapB